MAAHNEGQANATPNAEINFVSRSITTSASETDELIIDCRRMTGLKSFWLSNTDGTDSLNWEVWGSKDPELSEADFAAHTENQLDELSSVQTLAAGGKDKFSTAEMFTWLKLRIVGANTPTAIAQFGGS